MDFNQANVALLPPNAKHRFLWQRQGLEYLVLDTDIKGTDRVVATRWCKATANAACLALNRIDFERLNLEAKSGPKRDDHYL